MVSARRRASFVLLAAAAVVAGIGAWIGLPTGDPISSRPQERSTSASTVSDASTPAGGRSAPSPIRDAAGDVDRSARGETAPPGRFAAGMVRGLGALEHVSDRRVFLEANESIEIRLHPLAPGVLDGFVVRVDDGGLLNGRPLANEVRLPPGTERFTYTLGGHKGLYTVAILHGGERETLEFWVGPEPPQGRAGPKRTVVPPANLIANPEEQ